MSVDLEEIRRVARSAECLYSREEVEAALDRMAEEITADLSELNPLLLCVMLGGMLPAAKLIERLDFPFQYDYLHATRYRNQTRGGELFWLTRPSMDLRQRHIVVVDDILDEGITLQAIVEYCGAEGASSVRSAALVRKLHDRRDPSITVDYLGLDVPDRYVYGYGMDYKGYLRNAPGIYAIDT
ncbi:MAG: hypoxanthine-guanine phosphoribosyltransferase [Gammaproteobacteria bacterium]